MWNSQKDNGIRIRITSSCFGGYKDRSTRQEAPHHTFTIATISKQQQHGAQRLGVQGVAAAVAVAIILHILWDSMSDGGECGVRRYKRVVHWR